MVVIDATTLMLFFRPEVKGPVGKDGVPIDFAKERIENLIRDLEKSRGKIVVPTPVLSELLVRAGATQSQQIIERLNRYRVFSIEPFGPRAAIEVAAMTRAALESGNKKGDSNSPWAKVKFDRQVVAIAKVVSASMIYSDDEDVSKIAAKVDIPVCGIADLPIPDEARQGRFQFEPQKKPSDPVPDDETEQATSKKEKGVKKDEAR